MEVSWLITLLRCGMDAAPTFSKMAQSMKATGSLESLTGSVARYSLMGASTPDNGAIRFKKGRDA